MPVNLYICKEKESREEFTFLFIGWDKKLCFYWLNRFTDQYENNSVNKKVFKWNILNYLKKNSHEIDIAIVETNKKNPSESFYRNSFLLPRWMEMAVDIDVSFKKSRTKNIIRNIKKYSLDYEVKNNLDDFNYFYHKMYKPFLVKRHKESADIADFKHFVNRFRKGECFLFFAKKDNEPLAAALIEYMNKTYRLSAFGVKDGNSEIFKMGVIGALYYFVMTYYKNKGFESILIGNSMPVVFDGVTEFKMQIGAKPYLKNLFFRKKFYFIPLNKKPLLEKVLSENPLFYIQDNELKLAAFINPAHFSNKDEFHDFFRRLKPDSVNKANFFFFDNPEIILQWLENEKNKNIEFIDYYNQ